MIFMLQVTPHKLLPEISKQPCVHTSTHFVNYVSLFSRWSSLFLWIVHDSLKMAVHVNIRLVLLVVMLFGSLTAKPVEDPVPSRYYYDGESNDYFDVGKLFPILSWKKRQRKSRFWNLKRIVCSLRKTSMRTWVELINTI